MSGKLYTARLLAILLVVIQHVHRHSAFILFVLRLLGPQPHLHGDALLPARPLLLVRRSLTDVQTEALAIKVDLIAALLQNLCNIPLVLEFSQVNITPALLDSVSNQLGGTGLTLCADDGGLLLLAGFVDNEGGALSFLLCDLLGFYCSCELGGEGEMLGSVSGGVAGKVLKGRPTVKETSSSMMLNLAALLTRLSRTSLETFSRCVIS